MTRLVSFGNEIWGQDDEVTDNNRQLICDKIRKVNSSADNLLHNRDSQLSDSETKGIAMETEEEEDVLDERSSLLP